MRRQYSSKNLSISSQIIAELAVEYIREYQKQGLTLTLRQLYYVFVSRDTFPDSWIDPTTGSKNSERSYKRLGIVINDARMAGIIDWTMIEDRTRGARKRAEWASPQEVIEDAAKQYHVDIWAGQATRPEVWIEKDALVGVIREPCDRLGVTYLSCRGYPSVSELWSCAQRIGRVVKAGQHVKVFHLGDHDPSGIDMTRDLWERITTFVAVDLAADGFWRPDYAKRMMRRVKQDGPSVLPWTIDRIALNIDQVQQYDPPPNPTKLTDSRAKSYLSEHGDSSWELDALEPRVIRKLVEDSIRSVMNRTLMQAAMGREIDHIATLKDAAAWVEER